MTSYFENKRFLVTGASSGIGRAISVELVRQGAVVIAMARRESLLKELKDECGSNCQVFSGDVTKPEDCQRALALALEQTGSLHGLVHNAGISMRGLAEESRPEVYRQLMEVNFFSILNFYQAALGPLIESKGHLVAISSVMGLYSTKRRSGYCASKHALQGFMNSIRHETLDTGLHCMVVSPGFVNTQIARNALGPDGRPMGQDGHATLKGLSADHVAKIILRGIRKRKRDVIPAGPKEKVGLFLSRHMPGLADKLLSKIQVT